MLTLPGIATPRPIQTIFAAFAATLITVSLIWGIGTLFESRGAPFAQQAAAEHACSIEVFPSDHRACIDRWIAERRRTIVAAR